MADPTKFVVRPRFWVLWVRTAVTNQAITALVLFVLLTSLLVTRVAQPEAGLLVFTGGISAIAFAVILPAAWDRWRGVRGFPPPPPGGGAAARVAEGAAARADPGE